MQAYFDFVLIESRPDICFLRTSPKKDMITFIFFESTRTDHEFNAHFVKMLVLYSLLICKPKFNLSDTHNYYTFIDLVKNIHLTNYGYEIELPVDPLIDMLHYGYTQQAVKALKDNPITYRAYDDSMPNLFIDGHMLTKFVDNKDCIHGPIPSLFPFDSLTIPSIGNRLSMLYLLQEIDCITAKYKFNTRLTDILEFSLAIMFKALALPKNPTFYAPETTYACMKRDFLVEFDLPLERTRIMVANMNAVLTDAAELILQDPPTIRLSYVFMQQVFLPKLANLLEKQPILVKLMQLQYKSRSKPGDDFYADYCGTFYVKTTSAPRHGMT